MSLASNYQSVNFATEFAVDKIVGIYTGSFNAATQTTVLGGFLYQYAIPQTFTRPVFCELLWSLDGSTYADGGSGQLSGQLSIAYSDATNIYVTTTQSTGIVYYKIIATWIDNYDTTNPAIDPVLNTTQNFYFDTAYNYQKLYKQGTGSVSGTSGTVSYLYDLGYTPNFKVFFESIPGQVWPSITGGTANVFLYDALQYQCAATTTNTTMAASILGSVGSVSCKVWYRIYLDQ